MLLAVGQFVECKTSALGVGKLLAIDHGTATIGYFESPAKSDLIEVSVPQDTLVNTHLEEQVRVYFQDPTTLRWQVGRVLHYQESDREYLVQFPNDQRRLLPESLLTTRWSKPIADPTDHLALQLNETPFFHQGRSAFIHNLYSQRSACGGMPGLMSSAIDIVEHQISVVRRVLQDPFQRYLLADEVGLGKTIEAGILIRQYVLDAYESHRVLVIVPEALIKQWRGELCNRFHLEEQLGTSIHVVAHRDHGAISRLGSDVGMVVIDEAHHVAAWAYSSDAASVEIFRAIASITSPSERRVLLLSATPVLHNETAFLAMLHLIDPLLYELGDTDAFRQRVRLRQSIAELVVSLAEAESNFFISQTLAELSAFFHGDTRFESIRDSLVGLLANDVLEDDAERSDLIRALRTHISETWRIHRRLLRNRRGESTDFLLPGRAGGETCVWESPDITILEELLAEWRLSVAQLYRDRTSSPDYKSNACTLVRVIVEAAACDAHVLAQLIDVRLAAEGTDFSRLLLLDDELVALRNTAFYEGERDLLQQLRHHALRFDDKQRLQALKFLIAQLDRSSKDVAPAIVVFTNYPHTADRVTTWIQG